MALQSERMRHGAERSRFSLAEARRAIWEAKWELALPVIVLYGLFGGLGTLVEAGALARTALTAYLLDYDQSRRTLDLAASRARLLHELAEMARVELSVEQAAPDAAPQELKLAERFDGDAIFTDGLFKKIVLAFEKQFNKPLPVSARGATAIHRMMGYDHRGRVDVALNPDQEEGVWLREYLEIWRIPYFAFRAAIRGKSTAPHIHIGPPSARLRAAD